MVFVLFVFLTVVDLGLARGASSPCSGGWPDGSRLVLPPRAGRSRRPHPREHGAAAASRPASRPMSRRSWSRSRRSRITGSGKKAVKRRKLYPGYLMVQMELSDAVWLVARETPGFGDFVGGQAQPTPARDRGRREGVAQMDASKDQPKVAISFKKGDRSGSRLGLSRTPMPWSRRCIRTRAPWMFP
jgi:hypothetical protein